MGIKVDDLSLIQAQSSFIETKYIGKDERFKKTIGEAYLDLPNNQWKYRPYKSTVNFHNVDAKDIDCANDKGWVRGEYKGKNVNIKKEGKAYWIEGKEVWVYKPKGLQKTFEIQDYEFKMLRDLDVFDK